MRKENDMKLKNIKGHLNTVLAHKYFVGRYCFMCGLYLQGIMHDLSKFSPVEFWESCRYYTGTRSPIDECKDKNGVSMAWLHHRGRNYHHWEMWVDNFEKGMTTIKMPFKYALEMVCDFLGAGRAYNGPGFTMEQEWQWWLNKRKVARMHPDTMLLVDILFGMMLRDGIESKLKDRRFISVLKTIYEEASEELENYRQFIPDIGPGWRKEN